MNNDSPTGDNRFLERSRDAFAASVAMLDAGVITRLQAARRHALTAASGHRQSIWRAHPLALPAGLAAMVLVGVLSSILLWNQNQQPNVPFAAANNNDMAIVLSNDNLDMYADMDFYRWLQAQQQNQSGQESTDNDDNG